MSRIVTHEMFVTRCASLRPDIEIVSEYKGLHEDITYRCKKCGHISTVRAASLRNSKSCIKCNAIARKKDDDVFRAELKCAHNGSIVLIGQYKGARAATMFHCNKCTGDFESIPYAILKQNCPYCAGKRVLRGFNDLWTVRPDIARLLEDPNEGYALSVRTNKKIWFRCPDCGSRLLKSVNNVTSSRLVCGCNNLHASFGERIMASLLKQMQVPFSHDKTLPWSDRKRYDFVIKDNIICEMMGLQHYAENASYSMSLEEEQTNDEWKKQTAINHGYQYFAIDCSSGHFDSIKKNIINSGLLDILQISSIDWTRCLISSSESLYEQVADAWNEGLQVMEIAKKFDLDKTTVRKYLTSYAEIGLCSYSPEESRNRQHTARKNKISRERAA